MQEPNYYDGSPVVASRECSLAQKCTKTVMGQSSGQITSIQSRIQQIEVGNKDCVYRLSEMADLVHDICLVSIYTSMYSVLNLSMCISTEEPGLQAYIYTHMMLHAVHF